MWLPLCGRMAQAQSPVQNGTATYIEGIEALQAADFGNAVKALTRAIAADEENGSYRRARGVAYTLGESFDAAIADLDRAQRLDTGDTEARLWEAAAYRMSGDTAKGASLFTMRGLPHDYANLVYNLMAMQYWQSRYQGSYYDPATKRQVQTREPVKILFPDAAKAYGERNRATGAAAVEVITQQAKDAIQHQDWGVAIRDLVQLRANAPDDADLRGYWAEALLGAGDAIDAREEFTRTLCVRPLWEEGYAGQARAHALLNGTSGVVAAAVVPEDSVARFQAAANGGEDFPQLRADALKVLRWTNARRARYDESYQTRIRVLSVAMRDHANNSEYPEMLARFLYNFHDVPVLWNGPRGEPRQVRPQDAVERDNELKRGIELCDAALNLDARNANAMATEGFILYALKAVGVESLADRGLAIDGDNVRLLQLKIMVLGNRAGDLEAQASGLRAGHTDKHTENRSDGVYEVTTHYAPTAAELAQAAQLEAEAANLRRQVGELENHRKQVIELEIPGLLKEGTGAGAAGKLPEARRALLAAYSHAPDLQETLVQLAEICKREGDGKQQEIYSLLSQALEETTAAPELKASWEAYAHTMWKTADDDAARAAAIDPADARAAAYRSVIATHRDHPDLVLAQRWRNAALALEEARAKLSGTTLLAETPKVELIDLQKAGLTLGLHLEGGNAALAAGDLSAAIAKFGANVALEKRFNKALLVQLVPSAILPDGPLDGDTVPPAPSLASLLGESRLGLAMAYLVSRRPAEAQAQYAAVRAYLANWPATAEGRETLNGVDSWARLGQAEAAYASHDNQATLDILESDGWPSGLPDALEKRRKQLADTVHAERSGQSFQDVQRQMNPSPQQARIQSQEQEIAEIQKQRDAMAADLADPNMPPRERQVRHGSVDQLDSLIAQRKGMLQQLQNGGR